MLMQQRSTQSLVQAAKGWTALDQNHSHFVMVQDGTSGLYAREVKFRGYSDFPLRSPFLFSVTLCFHVGAVDMAREWQAFGIVSLRRGWKDERDSCELEAIGDGLAGNRHVRRAIGASAHSGGVRLRPGSRLFSPCYAEGGARMARI